MTYPVWPCDCIVVRRQRTSKCGRAAWGAETATTQTGGDTLGRQGDRRRVRTAVTSGSTVLLTPVLLLLLHHRGHHLRLQHKLPLHVHLLLHLLRRRGGSAPPGAPSGGTPTPAGMNGGGIIPIIGKAPPKARGPGGIPMPALPAPGHGGGMPP